MGTFLYPEISPGVQFQIRFLYGVLLCLFLVQTVPVSRWFFVSERWRGYAKSGPLVDLIQNPASLGLILTLWLGCGVALAAGFQPVLAALINLLLCRYFFVHMRWKGVLRGGGAPGFMCYWWSAVVFFLEYSAQHDPKGMLRPALLLAAKTDLALIMLSAGLYKLLAGYAKNNGMELGVVNPWWGYWWKFYRKIPPDNWVYRTMNHLAYLTEIVAAVFMLIPSTQLLGGLLIFWSFVFICTHIRLGFLTEMVMVTSLLYVQAGSVADRFLTPFACLPSRPSTWFPTPTDGVNTALRYFFWGYTALLVPTHAGLYYNFLARRRLPGPLQKALERYTNFFGIIIWRVFTIDVINFFVRIHVQDGHGKRREYTRFDAPDPASRFRYWHVSEFVCFASVFTTLKYYPDNPALFQERLLRYARTIPCGDGELLVFEYISVRKSPRGFDFVPTAEFSVEPSSGQVREKTLDPSMNIRAGHENSPVHAGTTPGSYAPAAASEKAPSAP